MKSIVAINSCNYSSTGNIMIGILKKAEIEGNQILAIYPRTRRNERKNEIHHLYVGGYVLRNLGLRLSEISGGYGRYSFIDTLKLLNKLNKNKPEVLHLHNLHDSYINLPLLFSYIKKHNIRTVWTLHDCWAMTGQCPYFTMVKCDKWKTGCHDCPNIHEYPKSRIDRTRTMWKLKRKWFTGVDNLTIVTPSQWLSNLVKESYLKDYPVKVIYNGIDLSVFKPMTTNFREKKGIGCDNKLILGVAFGWGKRKGLDVFIELAKRLPSEYQIVLVGTNESIDKQLPHNIISVHRTQNQTELAEIYSSADVFVNPTREEVLGLVNVEALACGTPVITFETGGSPECIDEKCGTVVPCDDIDTLEREIVRICTDNPFSSEDCIKRARMFDKEERFAEYIDLFMEQ